MSERLGRCVDEGPDGERPHLESSSCETWMPMPDDRPLSKDPETCVQSTRVDGLFHNWTFDGDDPYIVCSFCGERRDARTGQRIESILPGDEPPASVSKSSIETVTRQDYADSVGAVHKRLTEGPALPSDEEAEPPSDDDFNPAPFMSRRSTISQMVSLDRYEALLAAEAHASRLEAVVEVARRVDWESVEGLVIAAAEEPTEPERYRIEYRDQATAIASLMCALSDALDTAVVVPDADGGQP